MGGGILGFGILPGGDNDEGRYTREDAEAVARVLRELVGRYGILSVEVIGSVAMHGSSDHDVDLLVKVDTDQLGLTREQVQWQTWPELRSDNVHEVDPPASEEVATRVGELVDRIMEKIDAEFEAGPLDVHEDVINGDIEVGGRMVPFDIWLSSVRA